MPAARYPSQFFNTDFIFDAIIVGGGPAGLSAALALCRVRRTAVVFSSEVFRNSKAHKSHTTLTRDHSSPKEIRDAGIADIEKYGTTRFVDRSVIRARHDPRANIFEMIDVEGERWRGRKVVLATGASDVFPSDVEGYAENWGHNIYQCLYCDGLERSERPAGVLDFLNPHQLHSVSILFKLGCPRVTIFTNGASRPDEETAEAMRIARAKGAMIEERRISKLVDAGGDQGVDVVFEDGQSVRVGFITHKPATVANASNIALDLGVQSVTDGMGGTMLQRSEPFGETNVTGVFCAGDVGTPLKQVVTAMYQGSLAGMGLVQQLIKEEDEAIAQQLKGVNSAVLRRADNPSTFGGAQP